MLLSSADFFKIIFFKKFFQEHYQSARQVGFRSGPTLCLGPNCLQMLSANVVCQSFYAIKIKIHLRLHANIDFDHMEQFVLGHFV